MMKKEYQCYCGLYCENCGTKAKVEPAAKVLYEEMIKAGFEDMVSFIPNGAAFWAFLKSMAQEGTCNSCKAGSGNPACTIRICAKEKAIELCALCPSYPCDKFADLFKGYPMLKEDNALLRDKGPEAWANLQDQRKATGYTYVEHK